MSTMSVGVIGGADGPTAIFVTGSPWMTALTVFALLAALAAGILLFRSARKKKK